MVWLNFTYIEVVPRVGFNVRLIISGELSFIKDSRIILNNLYFLSLSHSKVTNLINLLSHIKLKYKAEKCISIYLNKGEIY